ncbi:MULTISPECIES: MFS transporter [unclassified Brachybacterium]|uniref:MFS transporter n=1 Tax=unclassified Brachybacterium TaxID=2623841 RepID=UPI003607393E
MRDLVLSGMALIAATYGLARFGYGLFLPQFTEEFAMVPAVSGAIQAGSFLSYCLAAAIAARVDAGPRAFVALAGGTAAAGSLGVALAPHAAVLAPGVVLAGAGAGFATPGLVTLIERHLVGARRESAQTVVNSGTGAGLVAAAALSLLAIGHWRIAWAVIAVTAAVAALATLRADAVAAGAGSSAGGGSLIRSGPPASSGSPVSSGPPAGPGAASGPGRSAGDAAPSSRAGLRALMAPLVIPVVAALLAGASSAAIWTFGRSVMADARPDQPLYSLLAWMVLGVLGMVGAIAAKLVQAWSLRTAWTLTAAAMAGATVLLGVAPGASWAAHLSMCLFGAGYTALSGVLIVWAGRARPECAAEGTVVLFIALALGQAAGSLLLGALLGVTSEMTTFLVAGGLGLAAIVPTLHRRIRHDDGVSTSMSGSVA